MKTIKEKSKELIIKNPNIIIEDEKCAELIQFELTSTEDIENFDSLKFYLQYKNKNGEYGIEFLQRDGQTLRWYPSKEFTKESGKTEIQIFGMLASYNETADETFADNLYAYYDGEEYRFIIVYPETSTSSPKVGDSISTYESTYDVTVCDCSIETRWSTKKATLILPENIEGNQIDLVDNSYVENILEQMSLIYQSTDEAETGAVQAKNSAEQARDLAHDWAEKETAVESGKYSAKYWAGQARATLSGKANKVIGATEGDVATLDPNGDLVDSNVPLTTLALKSETAHSMGVSIDTSTYVLTFSLKNSAGTEIDSDSIDLPLETMVVSGSYDSVNKKIILTLKSGSTIEFSVADLISGLVSTSTFETHTDDTDIHVTAQKQSDWDDKYDLPLTGIPKTDLASGVQTSLGLADSAYQKPSGGIPSSDMSSAVQTSLGKADTALQEHQDISGKADKATTLAGYGITDAKIESGTITLGSDTITPLTSHQDISGKADKVSGATNGNLAGLDSNGNLTDSGVPSTVVPTGGTTGQILKKKSATNYDTEWANEQDISGKADKDADAVTGNIAKFDSSGNPIDSGISSTDVAQKSGYYEGMTVGNAEQLISSALIHDDSIYTFRTAGGGEDIGNKSLLRRVTGGTVNWNQHVNASYTNNGFVASGTHITLDKDNAPSAIISNIQTLAQPLPSGHVYLVFFNKLTGTFTGTVAIGGYHTESDNNDFIGYLDLKQPNGTIASVVSASKTITHFKAFFYTGYTCTESLDGYFNCIDLTSMFGITIANLVYTKEQSLAGSGIAWLRSYGFLTKSHYPYSVPTLQSVCVSSHENTGFNQWDEEYKFTGINANTGTDGSWNDRICSRNYIPALPSTTYYFTAPKGTFYVFCYDSNKKFIGRVYSGGYQYVQKKGSFTTYPNTAFIRFSASSADYGTTYNHDICISIHWDDSRDGEYEPFKKYSYPMDSSVELRGIPKLDANNELYYDGDEYYADRSVNRKCKIIDLGTKTWGLAYGYADVFYSFATTDAKSDSVGICNKYVFGGNGGWGSVQDKKFTINQYTLAINIKDSSFVQQEGESYADYVARFKESLSGVYLVYELATPTIESATPFTEEQIVDNWGTECFTDGLTRDVFVPPMAVADYTQNLRDKLEASPSTPDADGLYLMKRENGQNKYIAYTSPIPTESTDGTYVLKATVADGAMTLAWVSEEV